MRMPSGALALVIMQLLACTPRGGDTQPRAHDERTPPAPAPAPTPAAAPRELVPLRGLSSIAAGVHHTCAIESGRVLCWGLNRFDILGAGPGLPQYVSTPHAIVGLEQAGPIVQVDTDYDMSCALAQDGAVYCWGDNEAGELGVGDQTRRAQPTRVAGLSASTLYLGYEQTCARAAAGPSMWCWGRGFALQPSEVAALAKVDQLANPGGHTCTLTAGDMLCWGHNSGGQIGNGEGGCEYDEPLCDHCKRLPEQTCKFVEQPTAPLGLPKLSAIASGGSYTYALDRDGGVWQWGQVGQTMSYGAQPNYQPQRVSELPPIVELSAGSSHVCARAAAGQLWCWGNDSFGQLGFESVPYESEQRTPYLVENLPPARAVAAGFYSTCALTGEGEQTQAWCWGDNGSGQLGDGTTERRHTPTLVRIGEP